MNGKLVYNPGKLSSLQKYTAVQLMNETLIQVEVIQQKLSSLDQSKLSWST